MFIPQQAAATRHPAMIMTMDEVDPFKSDSEGDLLPLNTDHSEDASVAGSERGSIVVVRAPVVTTDRLEVELSPATTLRELFCVLKERLPCAFFSDKHPHPLASQHCRVHVRGADTEEWRQVQDEPNSTLDGVTNVLLLHNLHLISLEMNTGEERGETGVRDTMLGTDATTDDSHTPTDPVSAQKKETKPSLMRRFRRLVVSRTSSVKLSKAELEVTGEGEQNAAVLFGQPLETLAMDEAASLPVFVKDTLEYLEREECVQDGLFRLSGTFTVMQECIERLDAGERLSRIITAPRDTHNVTGLVKTFLRRLPEPVLTFELYDAWRGMGQWTSRPSAAIAIARLLLALLPPLNRRVVDALFAFLKRQLARTETTRMTACNYGTVIGPNLLWHRDEGRQNGVASSTLGLSLQSTTLASQICTFLLSHYDVIFSKNVVRDDGDEDGELRLVAWGRVLYDFDHDENRDETSEYGEDGDDEEDGEDGDDGETESADGEAKSEDVCNNGNDENALGTSDAGENDACSDVELDCGLEHEVDTSDKPVSESASLTNACSDDAPPSPKDSFTCSSDSSASESTQARVCLREGACVFVSRVDDCLDGWWCGLVHGCGSTETRFPSNYVSVCAQLPDHLFQ